MFLTNFQTFLSFTAVSQSWGFSVLLSHTILIIRTKRLKKHIQVSTKAFNLIQNYLLSDSHFLCSPMVSSVMFTLILSFLKNLRIAFFYLIIIMADVALELLLIQSQYSNLTLFRYTTNFIDTISKTIIIIICLTHLEFVSNRINPVASFF